MRFIDLLGPDAVAAGLRTGSKHRLFEEIARRIAPGDVALGVLEALTERETMGGTALGAGAALPHGRCDALTAPVGGLFRLATPIAWGADDGQPVDMVAALVVPVQFTGRHLELLAELAEAFADPGLCARLRAAPDAGALRGELAQWSARRG